MSQEMYVGSSPTEVKPCANLNVLLTDMLYLTTNTFYDNAYCMPNYTPFSVSHF